MSTLYYGFPDAGGGGVLLTRLELLSYEREPMWNGPDYLATIHRLRVRGIYNPEVNAYDFASGAIPSDALPAAALRPTSVIATGAGNTRDSALAGILALKGNPVGVTAALPPAQSRGVMGPTTDRAIRHFMMQPRRRLIYSVGQSPLLVSPGLNSDGTAAQRDVYNGPMPLACDVVHLSGTRSFQVDYAIETYVNEAGLYVNPASVLLSHRWKRRESIDQDMYSTIVTEGAAIFRTDRLAFLGRVPDDFRTALFHPVVPGYVRRGWDIEASEDGSQLRYALVDKQTHLRVVPPGVTRIEAFLTAEVTEGRPMAAVASGLGGLSSKNPLSLDSFVKFFGSFIPLVELSFVVRVWGNDRSTRKSLERVAIGIARARLQQMSAGFDAISKKLAGGSASLTHDLNGSFVEFTLSVATTPADAALTFDGTNFPNPTVFFPDDDPAVSTVPSDATDGYLMYDVAQQNDLYQAGFLTPKDATTGNRTGTRSGLIRSLAAAALLGQDATPASPPAIMNPTVSTQPP